MRGCARRRIEPGRDRGPRRGRSRQPDDPGDAHRRRRDSADGVRRRPDGALHAADSGRRVGGDGVLAGRRVHRDAVGSRPAAARPAAPTATRRRAPRRGSIAARWRPLIGDGRAARWCSSPASCFLLLARCGARAARARDRQDAAVRQQERVSGDRRHARGHGARGDGARVGGARARGDERCRGGQRAELHRHGVAVQLQRPGAPLLPASRAAPRGPAGQPPAERRAPRAEPRDRQARPRSASCRSRGGSAPRSRCPKCRPARRCCRRWSQKSTGPIRRGGWSSPAR